MKIKFLKKYSDQLIGAGLLTALYLGEAALRPFSGPYEYQFAALVKNVFPGYSQCDFMLRLPAVLLTLASGALFYVFVKRSNFKRPGLSAAFYLLFPPVFYHGTGASFIPVLNCGIMLGGCGILYALKKDNVKTRLLCVIAVIAGLSGIVLYLNSDFFNLKDLGMPAALIVFFILNILADRREKKDKERFLRGINRIAFLCAASAGVLAVLIWVPVLLRHFKVDFPEGVAFYGRHEQLIRPMVMLIITSVWLGLARESKKVGKKLFLCSGALAFFLLFLPVTIPWQLQKDLYWHHSLTPVLKQIDSKNCVCLTAKAEAPFFQRFFSKTVLIAEDGKNAVRPENIKTEVEKLLKTSDVIVVCNSRKLEKQCPVFAGKRYNTGKFNLLYYYKHGVDKK